MTNKSQTLPRSMGSRVPALGDGRPQRLPTKPATTPPVIRRQFSVIIPNDDPNKCHKVRDNVDELFVTDYWFTNTQANNWP